MALTSCWYDSGRSPEHQLWGWRWWLDAAVEPTARQLQGDTRSDLYPPFELNKGLLLFLFPGEGVIDRARVVVGQGGTFWYCISAICPIQMHHRFLPFTLKMNDMVPSRGETLHNASICCKHTLIYTQYIQLTTSFCERAMLSLNVTTGISCINL